MNTQNVWRGLLKVFSFGLGVGLVLCLFIIAIIHYENRPKPWSKTAITAEYTGFNLDRNRHLMFFYSVKNNTEKEYTVTGKFAAIKNGQYVYVSDSHGNDPPLTADYSGNLIPPGRKIQVVVTANMFSAARSCEDEMDNQKKEDCYKEVRKDFDSKVPNMKGFAIIDDIDRYEIEFPDWRRKNQTDEAREKAK